MNSEFTFKPVGEASKKEEEMMKEKYRRVMKYMDSEKEAAYIERIQALPKSDEYR